MKTIASFIGESLAAVLIIIVCLSLPQALGLPVWLMPLFFLPAMLYLDWRLESPRWTRWGLVRFVIVLSAVLFGCDRWLPRDYWFVPLLVVVVLPSRLWLGRRSDRKEESHQAT